MCVWRHNQQFFTHQAALGPVVQIVENGLIWFGKRLDRGSFDATLKLARLVQIPNMHERGELFFPLPNRPRIRCLWLCRNIFFFFDGNGEFLAGKACYLVVQSGHNFRKSFYPRRAGAFQRITAYWCPNKRSARVRLKCSTMAWSR